MRRLLLLALALGTGLQACVWLLDFDGLQKGNADAGAPDAALEADSSGCDTDTCDDHDPCTLDHCGVSDGAPACLHDYSAGLGLDAEWPPVAADTAYRVTMTAGADAFYYSVYSTTGGAPELSIYQLGATAAAPTLIFSSSEVALARAPLSAAGLAVDTTAGERLHAFLGASDLAGSPRVLEIVFNAALNPQPPTRVGDSYDASSPFNYPVARRLGSSVHAAWINGDATSGPISVAGPAGVQSVGDPSLPVSTLTLIDTTLAAPAVLFTTTQDGVYAGTPGTEPTRLTECQTLSGNYLSVAASPIPGSEGVWLSNWTKYEAGSFVSTESHAVACLQGSCVADSTCSDANLVTGVRNSVGDSVHVQGDPAGVSYLVGVTSLATTDGQALVGLLSAALIRFENPFTPGAPAPSPVGESVTLASQPLGADFRGPDFPAVAIVAPDKVAIGWVQPAGSAAGDEFHLRRYKMCPPRP